MQKLRSFLYLDNYKMYSISSQLFEGLTEYIVHSQHEYKIDEENQKGPIGSGKIMADIIEKGTNQIEKKFLHDYSYNLFEDTLIEKQKVLEINSSNVDKIDLKSTESSFVKVTGNVVFNDLKFIEETINNFNNIGEAYGYVTQHTSTAQTAVSKTERQKKYQTFLNSLKEQGLNVDEDYLKKIVYLLNYGYNQQFEVQVPLKSDIDNYYLFSAQLNRENLKDNEYSIIKKYSRETEKEFKLFGILTQRLTSESKDKIFEGLRNMQNSDPSNMKEALINMVSILTNLEKTFTGKLNYEYVIDPIALYLEI